ncbi:tRNA pseudouridine(55) synthase TruB [Desulfobulbus alkaliphilus]|uniref:tRNA pseudouridine(55) synthase TruB n=1 Tax=Desulfobulbus alkaliphilus TaxID=869814 RepID=UPI001963ABF5|nr:tRNA pseudouridine(55) synthase TruB [Desulfobulbus alkaliphilus]MBM9536877.1 tRNA pseudouridine(55) synthase TruB [Desulfobulbus alkaliphilus]
MTVPCPESVDGVSCGGGVFLVDKPAGITSFAIVRKIRWLLKIKKVGHAGTLDPFATGLLIVCAGRAATRWIELFMAGRKTYTARLQLGVETETQDPEGRITAITEVPDFEPAAIDRVLSRHLGPQLQAPPPYSAAKHRGKPLYTYARQGVFIRKDPKSIEIFSLIHQHYDQVARQLDIEVTCSRGTYIRVLAADIGATLGCGAHLIALRRTASGPFSVTDALAGEQLFTDNGLARLQQGRMDIAAAVRLTASEPD